MSAQQQIADLAWAGQHEQAIAAATAALKRKTLAADDRMSVLDLRSDSYIAVGDLARAAADAQAMKALAKREGGAALLARALCRESLVQVRQGEMRAAVAGATAALKAARKSRAPELEGLSLWRLANAQVAGRIDLGAALDNAAQAADAFKALGDFVQQGRALQTKGSALWVLDQNAKSSQTAFEALALARRCGDHFGQAGALNSIAIVEPDLATGLRLYSQALDAFKAAGYVLGQALATGNLGASYADLGLYRRAQRLTLEAAAISRRAGAMAPLLVASWNLAEWAFQSGVLEDARAFSAEAIALTRALRDKRFSTHPSLAAGWLAMREGRFAVAARRFERAVREAESLETSTQLQGLTEGGRAHLAAAHPAAALALTRRAAEMHRAIDFAALDSINPAAVWWRHSQALRANGKGKLADAALEQARQLLLARIASLSDEGLRRNYLNKRDENREIVLAWLSHARERKVPRKERVAHLAGKVSLSEPFERLVDTGLRLNEIKTETEFYEFLVDEVTELTGAERVLLVLEAPDAPQGLAVAGSLVPRGEDEHALLDSVTPWLQEARRNRAVSLRHTPDGADRLAQRSHLIAPLIVQRELLGFIYCDIDGAFGRFHDGDRDLLAMLASQAAVALANVRFAGGLERKVAERTAELEQRASELTIINSIQQGIAGSLDFNAIVDLVGDKLRDVLKTDDIGIRWHDPTTNLIHYMYEFEHGKRLHVKPQPPLPGGPFEQMTRDAPPVVQNTPRRATTAVPGTDVAKSAISVPIIGSDRVLGTIHLEDHKRHHAFGESEVRLLRTVASSMGVALENARLFDETQRLLKETEQRAAEMAVINSIQQGIAAELNFQAIVDLVGDKLREVLKTQDIGIRLINRVDRHGSLPVRVRARRTPAHAARHSQTRWARRARCAKTRAPIVYNTRAELDASGIGVVPGTDVACSVAFVPIISGDRMTGSLLLENHEREHAFGESEVRLLQTVASSMGVALENARLFDETQRLLKETEQRAAEMSVINSIQQGIAGSLDFNGIVDLVGDKLREVFGTGDIGIAWNDHDAGRFLNIYAYEHGQRLDVAPIPLEARHTTRRGPLVYHTVAEQIAAGNVAMEGTDQSQSYASVQIVGSDRVLGRVQLENHEREHAFGDAEIRLLETVASLDGRRARKRAPLRRDAAAAEGNRAACRRDGGDQQHPAGHRRRAQLPGHRRSRRRQAARGAEER